MIETLRQQLGPFVRKALAKSMDSDRRIKDRAAYLQALADMDVLIRHYSDGYSYACQGCGFDAYEEHRVGDIDDCPEIRARAVAYGLLEPGQVFTWRPDTEDVKT